MHIGQSKPSHNKKEKTPQIEKILSLFFILFICIIFNSQKSFPQSNEDCLMCHEDETLTTERNGKEVSLFVNSKTLSRSIHGNLTCVSCHVGFNPEELPHKENIQPINCKSCHSDAGIKHPFHPQMMKSGGTNGTKDVSCKNCHGTHDVESPKKENAKWNKSNLIESCGNCHQQESQTFKTSIHFKGYKEGVQGAPNCISCHQNSIVVDNYEGKDTVRVKIAQEKLCFSCHLDNPQVRLNISPSAGFLTEYEHSVHGAALMGGNAKAANCVNCHGSHGINPGRISSSSVNKFNIPTTCGKCHTNIVKEYKESIHGVSFRRRKYGYSFLCKLPRRA